MARIEGANFWLSVLTDLQNRGVKDIMIACIDGLKGFPDAIKSVFPDTAVQLCVVICRKVFIELPYQFFRGLTLSTEIMSYVNQHRATSNKEKNP